MATRLRETDVVVIGLGGAGGVAVDPDCRWPVEAPIFLIASWPRNSSPPPAISTPSGVNRLA